MCLSAAELTSAAAVASTDTAPPPLHRLGLNVLTIIVSFLHPKYHKHLERTSWALTQAVWNRAHRLTTSSLASLIAMATLIAPEPLLQNVWNRARRLTTRSLASPPVAATTNTTSQPLLQNVWGLPLSLVFDLCAPDLTALRSVVDFSTVTSLTARGQMSLTVLTELLKAFPSLRTLNLGGNSLGAAGATAVADGLTHTLNLQTLNLGINGISNGGATAVADGLKHTPNLQTLDLSDNGIRHVGATAVADGLKHTPNLHTLDLSYNVIGDVGATAVADGVKHTPNLLMLNLSGR